MRPSFEKVSLLNGSPTLVRPALPSFGLNSSVLRSAIAFPIAALRSGVPRRSPSGAAKTMLRTAPCSDANSASIRSVALWVSEPGIVNSSRNEPPIVATRTMSAAMIPSHVTTTRQGLLAHMRIQRASAPVASRSCAERRSVVPLCPCSVMRSPPRGSDQRYTGRPRRRSTDNRPLNVFVLQTGLPRGTHRFRSVPTDLGDPHCSRNPPRSLRDRGFAEQRLRLRDEVRGRLDGVLRAESEGAGTQRRVDRDVDRRFARVLLHEP